MEQQHAKLGLEPLITITELAEYLGVPVATIYDWRTRSQGPVGHRFGKHVKFAVSDVRAWVAAQREVPLQPVAARHAASAVTVVQGGAQ